ncbi:hypothetical protein NL676_007137 [Syzygium grande]|nr:hypothetical protein NL676_007137 [Syzygium grande]
MNYSVFQHEQALLSSSPHEYVQGFELVIQQRKVATRFQNAWENCRLSLQRVTHVSDLVFSLPLARHPVRGQRLDPLYASPSVRSSASTLNFSPIGCLFSARGFILLSSAIPEDLSVSVDTRPCERGSTAPSQMLFLGESAFKAL